MTKQHGVHANYFEPEIVSFKKSNNGNKVILKIIGIVALNICLFQYACNRSSSLPKGEVNIVNIEPDESIAGHKQYDIEVFKSLYMGGNGYFVKHYHKEHDSIISYTAIYGDYGEFDKAAFNWINDSSVSIRLYNTTSKNEKIFKVSGFENRNGLETYDK